MSNLKLIADFLNKYNRVEFCYSRNSIVIQSFDFCDDGDDESEYYVELEFCTDSFVRIYSERIEICFICPFAGEQYETVEQDYTLQYVEEKCISFDCDFRGFQFTTH